MFLIQVPSAPWQRRSVRATAPGRESLRCSQSHVYGQYSTKYEKGFLLGVLVPRQGVTSCHDSDPPARPLSGPWSILGEVAAEEHFHVYT